MVHLDEHRLCCHGVKECSRLTFPRTYDSLTRAPMCRGQDASGNPTADKPGAHSRHPTHSSGLSSGTTARLEATDRRGMCSAKKQRSKDSGQRNLSA